MINNVTYDSAIWQNPYTKNPQSNAKVSFAKDYSTANHQTHAVFSKSALYSGGVAIGSGFMNATVNWSENSTADNPIMLVTGVDVDGHSFVAEVAINNINPRSASVIEMFALNGYNVANGNQTMRLLHQPMLGGRNVVDGGGGFLRGDDIRRILDEANSRSNAFTALNFLDPLLDVLETQRFHGNLSSYLKYRDMTDFLMMFPRS